MCPSGVWNSFLGQWARDSGLPVGEVCYVFFAEVCKSGIGGRLARDCRLQRIGSIDDVWVPDVVKHLCLRWCPGRRYVWRFGWQSKMPKEPAHRILVSHHGENLSLSAALAALGKVSKPASKRVRWDQDCGTFLILRGALGSQAEGIGSCLATLEERFFQGDDRLPAIA